MVSPRQRTAARLAAAQAARLALFYPPANDDPLPHHEHTRQGAQNDRRADRPPCPGCQQIENAERRARFQRTRTTRKTQDPRRDGRVGDPRER